MSNLALISSGSRPSNLKLTVHENPLYSYFANRVINRHFPHESTGRKVCRYVLKAFAIGASYGAQVPYVGICKTFAGENSVYAGFLSYGDVASFGTLLAWCYLSMINDAICPETQEEKIIRLRIRSSCPPFLIKTIIVALGTLSPGPFDEKDLIVA